ncbi:MAG: MFS transporter [Dehalococcoidia bacterium]|nr:MFS transporter [Dehalococcoidia bacterium]
MWNRLLESLRSNRVLLSLCVTTFFIMIGQGIISPIMPLYVKSFGISVTLVGVAIGMFGFARLIANIPIGYVAQRYGKRVLLVGGPVVSAAAALLMAFASSYPELIAYRFLSGLGSAMYVTGSVIYIADVAGTHNRARYLSLQEGSIVFGGSIGPVVGGLTADLWGLRAPFLFLAGFCLVGIYLAWTQMPEVKPTPSAVPAASPGKPPAARTGVLQILRDPTFFLIGLFGLTIFLTRTGGRGSIIPLLATTKAGLSATEVGIVFTIESLTAFATMLPAGILSDRLGRKVVVLPAAFAILVGLVLFTVAQGLGMYIVAGIVLGLGIGIAGSTPPAWAADRARAGNVGVTMGLYRTFGDAGNIIGPVLLGWIADTFSFESALLTNGALVLAAALPLWLVGRESVRRHSETQKAGERHQ